MSKIYAKYDSASKETYALDLADQLKARMIYDVDGIYVKFSKPKTPLKDTGIDNENQIDNILFGRSWTQIINLHFHPISHDFTPTNTLRFCGIDYDWSDDIPCTKLATMFVLAQKIYDQTIGTVRNENRKAKLKKLKDKLSKHQNAEKDLKQAIHQTEKHIK